MSSPNSDGNFGGLTTPILIADNVQIVGGKSSSPDGLGQLTRIGGSPAAIALEIQSITGGLIVPRMTAAQQTLQNGFWLDGTVVYITDGVGAGFQFRELGSWIDIPAGGIGNVTFSGTPPVGQFNIPFFTDTTGLNIGDSGVNISKVPATVGINSSLVTVNELTSLQIIEFTSLAPSPTFGLGDCAIGISDWSTGIRVATVFKTDNTHGCITISTALPPTTPNTSTAFEIQATDQAFLNARMSTTQKNALTAVNGMQVYDSTLAEMSFYQAGAWTSYLTASGPSVLNIRIAPSAPATTNLLLTDYILQLPTFSAGVSYGYLVVLPTLTSATAGQSWVIKDATGSAGTGTEAIAITNYGTDLIDGIVTYTLTEPYSSVTLYSDGSNYYTSAISTGNSGLSSPFVSVAADYAAGAADGVINVSNTSVARTITLPAPLVRARGQMFTVKDASGAAATNHITVEAASGLIDGASTAVINTNYGSLTFTSDGTNYYTTGEAGVSGGGGGVTSVTGTTNRITSTGGTTPAIDISASYVGQTSITTLGTLTSLTVGGAQFLHRNAINFAASPYTMQTTDYLIAVDSSGGAVSVLLGTPVNGRYIVIKDETGNAAANNITISGAGVLIDGLSTAVINTNYASLTLYSDGTNYFII